MSSLIHHAEILSLLAEGASLLGRTPDREKIRLLRDRVAETRRMHGLEGSSAGEETLVWLTVLDALVERLLHDQEAMAALVRKWHILFPDEAPLVWHDPVMVSPTSQPRRPRRPEGRER
ncbi:MAG: hypothetical protein HYR98_08525 [Nitrospirae bacterium]|nr:hypothetical protein [Nitrospirota bacterium]